MNVGGKVAPALPIEDIRVFESFGANLTEQYIVGISLYVPLIATWFQPGGPADGAGFEPTVDLLYHYPSFLRSVPESGTEKWRLCCGADAEKNVDLPVNHKLRLKGPVRTSKPLPSMAQRESSSGTTTTNKCAMAHALPQHPLSPWVLESVLLSLHVLTDV